MTATHRVRLTAGRVNDFRCPPAKSQAFLWDTEAPSLVLRVTPTGRKTYAFESRLLGQTVRIAIGTATDWSLDAARRRSSELKQMVDGGVDPREVERQRIADQMAAKVAAELAAQRRQSEAVTVGEVWSVYLEDRRPFWGARHLADHVKMVKAGGAVSKRGLKAQPDGAKPLTVAGPLFELLAVPLRELTASRVERWATEQAKTRATYARLCWRCLKVFLGWCAEHPVYAPLLASANPAKTKRAREALGKPSSKDDALQREQLPAWFDAVRRIQNSTVAAYLQTLLLTGARPGEVLTLKWDDINVQWRGMTIRDKVDGERVIPLTPYVSRLLSGLPQRNDWVFASTKMLAMDEANVKRREREYTAIGREAPVGDFMEGSASGHLVDASAAHRRACANAGLEGLTLHGLRRSFASLTEWLEIPAGVVAQIQGHKPSATAEKHYKRRPLDLLRLHHERIERWILERAGVEIGDFREQDSGSV